MSWRILVEDLQTLLMDPDDGDVVLPRKTTSFRAWAEHLNALATGPVDILDAAADTDFWLGQVEGLPTVEDAVPPARTLGDTRVVSDVCDASLTRALLTDAAATYHAQINDLLLTALARVLAPVAEGDAILVDIEGHGRDDAFEGIDLTRTVGWFTCVHPLRLSTNADATLSEAIRSTKEQRRQVPRHGLGHGILRHLAAGSAAQKRLAEAPRAPVSFNYLGQLDELAEGGLVALTELPTGDTISPRNRRDHAIDVAGVVVGGRLHLHWSFSPEEHSQAQIEALAAAMIAELEGIVSHCRSAAAGGYTPSDFPLSGLDQPTLDRVVGNDPNIEDIFGLTPAQQGMFAHALVASAQPVYVEQVRTRLRGDVDPAQIKARWTRVLERHPALRARLAWEDTPVPMQVIHRRVELPFEHVDLRALAPQAKARHLQASLAEDRQRGFDLARPPLMRVTVYRLTEDVTEVVWTFHHLLVDGWSVA
ncbi:MAG: condensation domain-containing protein, partial [Myxococcota bacterium]